MPAIRVNLGQRSYDIAVGAGTLAEAGVFLAQRADAKHVVLITDENVHPLHARRAAEAFSLQDIETDVLVIPPGEASKSLEMAITLWQSLLDLQADRRTVVAAVGGGVVGDLAGFAAATFARGLRFLQVPTSLIGQVDSAVGGKTGINLPGAKNIIGAFHQPLGVLIDVDVLATLPEREYRAGLAEVVKYGAALDAELFAHLEQNAAAILARKQDVLPHVIARCCQLKADVVQRDERDESGVRAALNFGHSFGHALEVASGRWPDTSGRRSVASGQKAASAKCRMARETETQDLNLQISKSPNPHIPLLHGEAVAVGMVLAARLAERMGRVDAAYTARLISLLNTFGLPTAPPAIDSRPILKLIRRDKKSARGRTRFVLPGCLGSVDVVDHVGETDLMVVLRAAQ
jgi:3-dehydroquinate synthase